MSGSPALSSAAKKRLTKERNHGLDLLRIASICGVVAIHVFGVRVGAEPKAGVSWWIATTIDIGFIWVVPVFIMISGALLLGSPQLHTAPARFYKKRAVRIIPALIAWNLIYLLGVRVLMRGEVLSTSRIVQLFYDGSVFTQLYYLWIVVGLYAVAPLLGAFLHLGSPSRSTLTAAVLVSVSTIAYILPSILVHFDISRSIRLNFLTMWIPYVGYFVAGYALKTVRLKGYALLAVSVITAAMLAFTIWHYGNRGVLPRIDIVINESYFGLLVTAASLGIFVVTLSLCEGMRMPRPLASAVVSLSNASFGVFLVHYVIFEMIRLNVAAVSTQHSLRALALAYLLTLVSSFLVALIALRVPALRRIF